MVKIMNMREMILIGRGWLEITIFNTAESWTKSIASHFPFYIYTKEGNTSHAGRDNSSYFDISMTFW